MHLPCLPSVPRYIAKPDDVTDEGSTAAARLLQSRDGKVQAVAIQSELPYDHASPPRVRTLSVAFQSKLGTCHVPHMVDEINTVMI